jgi:YHS domain-containing protein
MDGKESSMKHVKIALMLASLVAALFAAGGALTAAAEQRLALRGYDPVAYFTEKRPMRGDPQYQHEWDGAIYRFASAKHLELFKVNPDRYLPQYNNFCAASLAKGIKYHGDPEHWLVVDGRLYLFGGPAGPPAMKADPVAMKKEADQNWQTVSKLPDPPTR